MSSRTDAPSKSRAPATAILPSPPRSTARASPWCSIPAQVRWCSPTTTPRRAGLPLDLLDYTVSIDTANGRTRAAPVTLDRIAIGGLEERSVEALVAQPGQLKTSLLGMSFLNRLQSWQVSGDRLVLQGLSVSAKHSKTS